MSFSISGASLGVTIDQWCERLLEEHLERGERRELDKLSSALTTTATTLVTSYGATGLKPQARIEVEAELMHVWDVSGTQTYEVERGHAGSTAASHADGALVRVGPRFPKIVLAETLRREIRSWPPELFAVATGSFEVGSMVEAFDLDGLSGYEGVRLLRVQRDHHDVSDLSWPEISASLESRQDAASFASGYALRLPQVPGRASTLLVTIGYQRPVAGGTIDFTADLGETFHLNQALADAAMYGVAGQLLLANEVARTDDRSQPRPRRGEDVPPGYPLQAGQALLLQRDRLLRVEAERLRTEYPPRF